MTIQDAVDRNIVSEEKKDEFAFIKASDVSFDIGSGAVSQLIREATYRLLRSPRPLYLSFRTQDKPLLLPLAYIKTYNRISYSNFTVRFYPNTIRLKANNVRMHSVSNITPNIWPISFGDETVNLVVLMGDVEVTARMEKRTARMLSCSLQNTIINATSKNYWMIDTLLLMASNPIQSYLQELICPSISKFISNIESATVMNMSLNEILPVHIRNAINTVDSSLFYRLTSITAEEKHILIVMQMGWKRPLERNEEISTNVTNINMKWDNEDRIVIWIDDTALTDFLNQIKWDFQWMEETIAVTSPVIPLSSREFLSTLCTSCYFLLNVWANGPPVLTATNNTVVLEKRDRLNLRVVNPDKNVTSVFVSMFLALTAELRPVIDSGTLRTLVQLLDTSVVMESGAFPPSWSFFVQDLIKEMITQMMWPEMRKQIEELTYSEGIRLAKSCGINPQNAEILIGEGRLGLSATLNLQSLQAEECIKDLKSALPNTAKLFPK
ncbi:unnamed protein product [Thelazia callipaeda]|uniref:Fatty-acid and retinol-binding protein 1 n=1 Tax=Thelazia callipaeda TaxID=103827 RepID=A0A0N5CV81_THECL|nr:unnamed protein product [Thelazia callipaeda]